MRQPSVDVDDGAHGWLGKLDGAVSAHNAEHADEVGPIVLADIRFLIKRVGVGTDVVRAVIDKIETAVIAAWISGSGAVVEIGRFDVSNRLVDIAATVAGEVAFGPLAIINLVGGIGTEHVKTADRAVSIVYTDLNSPGITAGRTGPDR